MGRKDLPEPVGFPQLFVTHKKACLLDAHRPGTVLLSLRKPKSESAPDEVSCEMDDGPWKLEMENSTVICSYYNGKHTGVWRAELLPSPGSCTLVLNSGFQAVPDPEGYTCAIIFVLLVLVASVCFVGWHCAVKLPKQVDDMHNELHGRFNYLENRFQSLHQVVLKHLYKSIKVMPPGTELGPANGEFDFGPYRLELHACVAKMVDRTTLETRWMKGTAKPEDHCVLTMQRDGNLVMYDSKSKPVWASRDEMMGTMCPLGITVDEVGNLMCAPK